MDNAEKYSIVVIGAGAAGLTAAAEAAKSVKSVLVLEYEPTPGGVLGQCIHPGFFGESLEKNGPEYRDALFEKAKSLGVSFVFNAFVTAINGNIIEYLSPSGKKSARGEAVILASGCREKSAGELGILGSRPAGVYTGGEVQKIINIYGCDVGDDAVIVGGGDIGMIIARRLRLTGKNVVGIIEAEDVCGAMPKNQMLCARELGIPVFTGSTVTAVHGQGRVSSVTVHDGKSGEDRQLSCGMLVIAAGLVPENDLAAGNENVFVCGNAHHICPNVDAVSEDAKRAAAEAVSFLKTGEREKTQYSIPVPERRSLLPYEKVCPLCHNGCVIHGENGAPVGAKCPKGERFFLTDDGRRYFSASVPVEGSDIMLPVRTDRPVLFGEAAECFSEAAKIAAGRETKRGDTVYRGSYFNLIACTDAFPAED